MSRHSRALNRARRRATASRILDGLIAAVDRQGITWRYPDPEADPAYRARLERVLHGVKRHLDGLHDGDGPAVETIDDFSSTLRWPPQ